MFATEFEGNSIYSVYADYDKYISVAKAEGKAPVSIFNFVLGRY